MISFKVTTVDQTKHVAQAVEKAAFKNVGHAASRIRKDAIDSIEPAAGPSPPGTPPHTHTGGITRKGKIRKGNLQRAIAFAQDKQRQEAVVGPRASVVDQSGAAHEFGESYKGEDYPERPFMGPALEANEARFASDWAGSIGE